ncbi:hypothetical protein [Aliarcobacter vitoriensis]|uniref:Uncharacterized protein n=1 Tax=Aliarcobacter vitoriensis TaxID=2011099 RepID=A0A366MSJ0_9BACT|nr:hypothetical protein [Aliarcobacter vitoriensis]RBQ28574.1 hypothetical protein CRU91_08675 [Aliarcobacter vitoriensis]
MAKKDLLTKEDKDLNQEKFSEIINNSALGRLNVIDAFETLKTLPNLRELTSSHLQTLKTVFSLSNEIKTNAMDKIPVLDINKTLDKLENRLENANSSEELKIICDTIIKITEKHYNTISAINKNDVNVLKKAIDFVTEVTKTAITVKSKIF